MAIQFGSASHAGTVGDDIILGSGGTSSNLSGNTGDDVIYGDFQPFAGAGGSTALLATDLMGIANFWNAFENSDVLNATSVAHGTAVIEGNGAGQWYEITVVAGQRLTVDIDYGNSVAGVAVDSRVTLMAADGTTVVRQNTDSVLSPADYGSTSGDDSRLEHTFTTGGTFFVRIDTATGTNIPFGANLVANFSLTGQATSGTVVAGDDTIYGGSGQDFLHGMGGNDFINGGSDADRIYGGTGNDIINGSLGRDSVFGGAGNDRFQWAAGGSLDGDDMNGDSGLDTLDMSAMSVLSTGGWRVDFSTILGRVELIANTDGAAGQYRATSIEAVIGTDEDDIMIGGQNAVSFYGGFGDDNLTGGRNNDVLDGGFGIDLMAGGLGNDKYYVDNLSDTVTEASNAGIDTLFTEVDFALDAGSSIEIMRSQGTGLEIWGNALKQKIFGDAGDNVLYDGGGAADIMAGRAGDDLYIVSNSGAKIREGSGGGFDEIQVDDVSYNLRDIMQVEVLTVTDTASLVDLDLTGNKRDNTIIGNDGDNVITGGKGNDQMTGNGGVDTFVIREFPNNANRDSITDFTSGEDVLELGAGTFTRIGVGALDENEFRVNTTGDAENASDRLIYNSDTGELFYDRDGSGNRDAYLVVTLENLEAITIDDILMI